MNRERLAMILTGVLLIALAKGEERHRASYGTDCESDFDRAKYPERFAQV